MALTPKKTVGTTPTSMMTKSVAASPKAMTTSSSPTSPKPAVNTPAPKTPSGPTGLTITQAKAHALKTNGTTNVNNAWLQGQGQLAKRGMTIVGKKNDRAAKQKGIAEMGLKAYSKSQGGGPKAKQIPNPGGTSKPKK